MRVLKIRAHTGHRDKRGACYQTIPGAVKRPFLDKILGNDYIMVNTDDLSTFNKMFRSDPILGAYKITLTWAKQTHAHLLLSSLSTKEFLDITGIECEFDKDKSLKDMETATSMKYHIGHIINSIMLLTVGDHEEMAAPMAFNIENLIDGIADSKLGKRFTRLFAPHMSWTFGSFTVTNTKTSNDTNDEDGVILVSESFAKKVYYKSKIGDAYLATVFHDQGFAKGLCHVVSDMDTDVMVTEVKSGIGSTGKMRFFGFINKVKTGPGRTDQQTVLNFFRSKEGGKILESLGNEWLEKLEIAVFDTHEARKYLEWIDIDMEEDKFDPDKYELDDDIFLKKALMSGVDVMRFRSMRSKFLNLFTKKISSTNKGRIISDRLFRLHLSPVIKSFNPDGTRNGINVISGTCNVWFNTGILEISKYDAEYIRRALGGADFDADSVLCFLEWPFICILRNPNGHAMEHYVLRIDTTDMSKDMIDKRNVPGIVKMFETLTPLPAGNMSIRNDIANGNMSYVEDMIDSAHKKVKAVPKWLHDKWKGIHWYLTKTNLEIKRDVLDNSFDKLGDKIKDMYEKAKDGRAVLPWNVPVRRGVIDCVENYRKAISIASSMRNSRNQNEKQKGKDIIAKKRRWILDTFKETIGDRTVLIKELACYTYSSNRGDSHMWITPNVEELKAGYKDELSPGYLLLDALK